MMKMLLNRIKIVCFKSCFFFPELNLFKYFDLPERPPNVDTHRIQPEESDEIAKVHTYRWK